MAEDGKGDTPEVGPRFGMSRLRTWSRSLRDAVAAVEAARGRRRPFVAPSEESGAAVRRGGRRPERPAPVAHPGPTRQLPQAQPAGDQEFKEIRPAGAMRRLGAVIDNLDLALSRKARPRPEAGVEDDHRQMRTSCAAFGATDVPAWARPSIPPSTRRWRGRRGRR